MFGQCRFSRAVVPQDRYKLSGFDIQGDIIDRADGSRGITFLVPLYVIMNQVSDLNHGSPFSDNTGSLQSRSNSFPFYSFLLLFSVFEFSDLQFSALQFSVLEFSDLQFSDLQSSVLELSNLQFSALYFFALKKPPGNTPGGSIFLNAGNRQNHLLWLRVGNRQQVLRAGQNPSADCFHQSIQIIFTDDGIRLSSDELKNDFHRSVTAALTDLDDPGVTAVPAGILGAVLCEHLVHKVNLLCSFPAALGICGNFHDGIEITKDLPSGVQTAGRILGNLLLDFVVNGHALAVNNLFDALAVFVLAGNFSLDSNCLIVVILFGSHS